VDFFGGNWPLELGQVQNSKFKHAPNQVARYPPKVQYDKLLFF
jgi:hypothetical protein